MHYRINVTSADTATGEPIIRPEKWGPMYRTGDMDKTREACLPISTCATGFSQGNIGGSKITQHNSHAAHWKEDCAIHRPGWISATINPSSAASVDRPCRILAGTVAWPVS